MNCKECKKKCANAGLPDAFLEPPAFCDQIERQFKAHFFEDEKTQNIGFRLGYSENPDNSLVRLDTLHGVLTREQVIAIEQFIKKMMVTAEKTQIIKPNSGDIIILNREQRRKLNK